MFEKSLAAVVASVAIIGCGGVQSYPLPVSADDARYTFAPLKACASQQGLQISEHPDSVNVRYDASTWVQFMIQGPSYNMVVVMMGTSVPEPERPARLAAAKAKGDELFACALKTPRPPR